MRRVIEAIIVIGLCWFAEDVARAQDLTVPQNAVAGQSLTISAGGDSLLVIGPGTALKKDIKGGSVTFSPDEIKHSGDYIAIAGDTAKHFFVTPGDAAKVNFLARPSRVPVATPDVISGVAFVFDKDQNMVTSPLPVKFDLSVNGTGSSREVTSKDGVAWLKAASANHEGAAQFVASVNGASVRRVIQQVASDPCNLRMHAAPQGDQIVVETDPIRDCSGNAVPDGTIVTFIQTGGNQGRSTVDARIKKGIARATLPNVPGSTLSVASGVVLGNELHVAGGR